MIYAAARSRRCLAALGEQPQCRRRRCDAACGSPGHDRAAAPATCHRIIPATLPAAAALRRGGARRAGANRSRAAGHPAADPGAAARRSIRTASRSLPANGAGARRSAPSCTRCRSSCASSATAKRWSSRIVENIQREDLTAAGRGRGYRRLIERIRLHPGADSPRRSARAAATSPTRCACWSCRRRAAPAGRRQAQRRSCPRADRHRGSDGAGGAGASIAG